MTDDYIKHKEYKLPNGRTVTADFDELGLTTVTIQAMDALFDIFNSSDVVDVVRCKDCRHNNDCEIQYSAQSGDEFFCGCGERKDNG